MPKKTSDSSSDGEAKSAPQVNDVAKPGETAAPPTSRPIITRHTEIIKDPMVADTANREEAGSEFDKDKAGEPSLRKNELKINPINIKEDDKEKEPKEETKQADEDAAVETKTEVKEDSPEKAQESKTETEPTSSETAAIDSLANSAELKKVNAKEAEEEQKQKEKIQELVTSKKYFVPIVEGGHKATSEKIISWVFLILLLVAVGVYLAVDAGYIDIGINLPYDFIKL